MARLVKMENHIKKKNNYLLEGDNSPGRPMRRLVHLGWLLIELKSLSNSQERVICPLVQLGLLEMKNLSQVNIRQILRTARKRQEKSTRKDHHQQMTVVKMKIYTKTKTKRALTLKTIKVDKEKIVIKNKKVM